MSFFINPIESWIKLKKDSNLFQLPTHYNHHFQYTETLEKAVKDILNVYSVNQEVKASKPLLGLFVDNKAANLNDYFTEEKCIQPNESIEEWGIRIFNNKKYILVVNCIERFSDSTSSSFASLMKPYLEQFSIDQVSFRISLFIGNAVYTPFGAHVDIEGLDVIHFHLGPGSKSMTLWEKEEFITMAQSQEKHCYDFKKHLKYGKEIQLSKGDVLFFPADKYYHIGEYHDFSIAAAIGIIKESPISLYKKALSIWEEDITQQLNKEVIIEGKEASTLTQKIPANILNTSIQDIIESYKLKKESNVFMHNRPILKKLLPIFLINKKIILNQPFPILINSERNTLYSRGRKLDIFINKEEGTILDQLKNGEIVTCKKSMTKNTLGMLTWLFNTRSVIFAEVL